MEEQPRSIYSLETCSGSRYATAQASCGLASSCSLGFLPHEKHHFQAIAADTKKSPSPNDRTIAPTLVSSGHGAVLHRSKELSFPDRTNTPPTSKRIKVMTRDVSPRMILMQGCPNRCQQEFGILVGVLEEQRIGIFGGDGRHVSAVLAS